MEQQQSNKQEQMQWQYVSRGLNSLFGSLNRLNAIDSKQMPENYEQAKKSTPKVQQEIDNCITQILASTMEVKHYQTLNVIKKRVAARVLEWLSLRKNTKSDVLDELCSVLLYNCVDIPKEVPQRLQDWDGKISEEELKEFAGGIISAGHELDKSIQDEQKGRAPILNEIAKLKDLNYKDGIVKLQNRYPDLSNELLITLEGI